MSDDCDDDENAVSTQICVDCKAVSPPINTNYTLIGTHSWRVTRVVRRGLPRMDWRCADCWNKFKKRGG